MCVFVCAQSFGRRQLRRSPHTHTLTPSIVLVALRQRRRRRRQTQRHAPFYRYCCAIIRRCHHFQAQHFFSIYLVCALTLSHGLDASQHTHTCRDKRIALFDIANNYHCARSLTMERAGCAVSREHSMIVRTAVICDRNNEAIYYLQ